MSFKILEKDQNSQARTGKITTPHGVIETPAFVVVGTRAKVKCLEPQDLQKVGTQLIIANTFHLWRDLGDKLDSFPGLAEYTGWGIPTMTDSGGYQVFSFGFRREDPTGKISGSAPLQRGPRENMTRITDEGVFFRDGDTEGFLNPRISIGIQEKLGADIIFAFDECTSPNHPHEYIKKSLERTEKWAVESLTAHTRKDQLLYGIVQGSLNQELRTKAAKFLGSLDFGGYGVGGSLPEEAEKMHEELGWITANLPEEKPRHLLGVGKIRDILLAVDQGMDTFDCVIPTREARHGRIWTLGGHFDILKQRFADDTSILVPNCQCPACQAGTTKSQLRALFKEKNPEAGHLASIHNVFFLNDAFRQIREAIHEGRFQLLKEEWL